MIYSVNDVTIMFVLRTMNDNFSGSCLSEVFTSIDQNDPLTHLA